MTNVRCMLFEQGFKLILAGTNCGEAALYLSGQFFLMAADDASNLSSMRTVQLHRA